MHKLLALLTGAFAVGCTADALWDFNHGYVFFGAWMMMLGGLMAFCATFAALWKP